jgi:hypothetical protein
MLNWNPSSRTKKSYQFANLDINDWILFPIVLTGFDLIIESCKCEYIYSKLNHILGPEVPEKLNEC